MPGIAAYRENAVVTQPAGRIIVLLYEGAVRFLRQAMDAMASNDIARKSDLICRAQAIIDELNLSLDMDAGGEVASNLRSLYNFMRRHLTEANTRKDPQRIRDVITCLEDLLAGWRAITD
jgi:flagellar secretion chaperone FliS